MTKHLLPILSVLSIALAVRMPLLLISSLPLNIDAYAQVSIAEEFLASGIWTLDEASPNSYNLKMPIMPLLLAGASALLGVEPLPLAAPLMILVGLVGVLGMYAFAHHLTRSRFLATWAALILALLGPFIFVGSTLIKEALALALLPTLLLLFYRRQNPTARILAAVILLLLPLLHHLSMLMGYGIVALLVLLDAVRRYWAGQWSTRRVLLDIVLGPGLFVFGLWYYQSVNLGFFNQVWNPDEVALFLSVALLMGAAAILLMSTKRARPWFTLSKKRRLPTFLDQKAIVIIGAFFLVLANAVQPLIPGTVPTSPWLFIVTLAYLPLAVLALIGLNVHRLSSRARKALPIALLLAPLTVLVFALLRGLDPLSHLLAYRSVDYLDFGLALTVATALVQRMGRRRRALLSAGVIGALFLTLPMTYATERVFQVQNTTFQYELAAFGRLEPAGVTTVSTDQRMADVIRWYFHQDADATLPLRILGGASLPVGSLLLMEENWQTRGAQVYPLPFQVIEEGRFQELLNLNQLVYQGGGDANPVYLVKVRS
ncbi:MAG: hypothetical protein ACE5JQ_13910 [Candidatus Methylomirabilales bacterium]